jgi:hypothetical protein
MDKKTSPEEFLGDIYIPFDCEFLLVQRSAEGSAIFVTETYRITYNSALQTSRVARFTPGIGLSWSSAPFFVRRKDLQGLAIKAAVIPYVCITYIALT